MFLVVLMKYISSNTCYENRTSKNKRKKIEAYRRQYGQAPDPPKPTRSKERSL